MTMPSGASWDGNLDEQADRIEQMLASMALPVRVNGGHLHESGVRYLVTPLSNTTPQALLSAADKLARAIGMPGVLLERQPSGLSLDIPLPDHGLCRLWPVFQAAGPLPRLSAVWGLQKDGAPFLPNLADPGSWHVMVTGGEAGRRGDWLRGLLLGLALTTPPAQLQLLGIDFGGRQLSLIEALPHALRPLALLPRQASALLEGLQSELERRAESGVQRPHIVLAIADLDDLGKLPASDLEADLLGRLMQLGRATGLHLLLAHHAPARLGQAMGRDGPAQVVLVPSQNDALPPTLDVSIGPAVHHLTSLHLGVVDMDIMVQRLIHRRQAGKGGLRYSMHRPSAGW
jgi:hypothetical protein